MKLEGLPCLKPWLFMSGILVANKFSKVCFCIFPTNCIKKYICSLIFWNIIVDLKDAVLYMI